MGWPAFTISTSQLHLLLESSAEDKLTVFTLVRRKAFKLLLQANTHKQHREQKLTS